MAIEQMMKKKIASNSQNKHFGYFYFKINKKLTIYKKICYNILQFGSGSVKTDDFNYYLPEELIAQTPLEKRDNSKLMVVDRKTGKITHDVFHNIIDYLNKDDVLVLNDTKVLPARIIGEKADTGAVIELLLLNSSL